MLIEDRRFQAASQAVALALMVSRAQEALYRVKAGRELTSKDSTYFKSIATLFLDARDGYKWIESAVSGNTLEPKPLNDDYLRAFEFVLPVLRTTVAKHHQAMPLLVFMAKCASDLGNGSIPSVKQRERFMRVLSQLGSYATGQGQEALESISTTTTFGHLPKVKA